jgi:hypothetical protein
VSNWTLIADVSGIVAVASSLVAVLAVIPLIVRRQVPSGSRPVLRTYTRRHLAGARDEAKVHDWSSPIIEFEIKYERVRETTAPDDLIAGFRIKFRDKAPEDKSTLVDKLFRREAAHQFHREATMRVIRSTAFLDLLRSTARGLDEEADIIAERSADQKRPPGH